MVQIPSKINKSSALDPSLKSLLVNSIEGDIRFDEITREIYSTDASIYKIMPICVAIPKTNQDVKSIIQIAWENNIPVLPRGGGSSLSGQTVNEAIVIDFTKYLNNILQIDTSTQKAIVEPGITIDLLNHQLKKHNLFFTPDPSTTNRATVGGVIGNNSCGAHSIIYGKTIDHILKLETILSDGSDCVFEPIKNSVLHQKINSDSLESNIYSKSFNLQKKYIDEIKLKFPNLLRRVGGYNLDSVSSKDYFDITKLIVGSEGTLATILQAEINLEKTPKHKGLLVLEFDDLIKSMEATTLTLESNPSSVEHIGEIILNEARKSAGFSSGTDFLSGKPNDLLVIESDGDSIKEVESKLKNLQQKIKKSKLSYASTILLNPDDQNRVWNIRKAGLGLLMKVPGEAKAIPFVEDTAVSPDKLPEYVKRFDEIVQSHQTTAGYYGHASVGCLHIRPLINLKDKSDIEKMHSIAEEISNLVIEFNGSMSGEHGDGIVRGAWTKKMFGNKVYEAFQELKKAFDPKNIMNPGKIINTPKMTSNLRYGENYKTFPLKTKMSFKEEGGFASAIEMCNGQGACRKIKDGSMCPSFMATREEVDSTRGRANALRAAMSGSIPLSTIHSKEMFQVLDLCLECKACKKECPSGVDMAKIKYEFLHQYYQKNRIPLRSRIVGNISTFNKLGSIFPKLFNIVINSYLNRWIMDQVFSIDKRRKLPNIIKSSFKITKKTNIIDDKTVIFFLDTFTKYNHPNVGYSTLKILKKMGLKPIIIDMKCCGRPMISKGLLNQAEKNAKSIVKKLFPLTQKGIKIIGVEPSCISALKEDYPSLLNNSKEAISVSKNSMLLQEFLLEKKENYINDLNPINGNISIQIHCHERAMKKSDTATKVLEFIPNSKVTEIPSGCCGMAGSFGYEKEHFDISKKIANERLLPFVNNLNSNDYIVTTGVSCRHQILDFTDKTPLHFAEILASSIKD